MKTLLLACTALATPARAFADLNFDATAVEPDKGIGDPLPTGWYNVSVDETEKKPTSDGTGEFLQARFTVLDGQYQGRKIYTMFNLKNANQQAVEIAQRQLSALCHAVGVLKPTKSEQLHNIPLKVRVGQKPASGGYDAGNKITAYKNINETVDMAGGDAGAAAFGAGAATPPPVSGTESAPWATGAAAAAAVPDTAAPPPPAAPEVPAAPPAAPVHDAMAAALADGWVQHPSSPPHLYKGQEVKTHDEVKALYPAPAVPAAPSAPEVPAAPPAPPAGGSDAQTAPPPWATPKQ